MENNKLIESLVKAQLEIKAPSKDKVNPRFKTRYSSIDAIYLAVSEPLAANGLKLTHTVEMVGDKPWLVTSLLHHTGERMESRIMLFVEQQTSQGFASALTYARRYGISLLLALPSDDDDDGEAATEEQKLLAKPLMTPAQLEILKKEMGSRHELRQKILEANKVSSFSQIASDQFDFIMQAVRAQ